MALLPREEKYFGMLNQLASPAKEGGELFVRIFEDYGNHAHYAEQIKGNRSRVRRSCGKDYEKAQFDLHNSD